MLVKMVKNKPAMRIFVTIMTLWLTLMVGGKLHAQAATQVPINRENILGILDGYMLLIRRECRVDIEFPQIIMQYTEIRKGLFSCRDLNFRTLRYNKQTPINPDVNCLTQNQMTINECELSKRNCKLAIFDLKGFYEKCRTDILSEEQ